MSLCFCGKELKPSHNYCDFQCMLDAAKAEGGVVYTPNGLPVKCIRADGNMYEHEHGDHPDYKFPVKVEYIGPIGEDEIHDYTMVTGKEPSDEEAIRKFHEQTHALLYTDGTIAVTLYECCYSMWLVKGGKCLGGKYASQHRLATKLEENPDVTIPLQ